MGAALMAASLGMLAEAPGLSAPSEEAAKIFALSGVRTAPVQSYTSKLHVDFALRSFPYLKFHLEGHIEYNAPTCTPCTSSTCRGSARASRT